MLDRLHARLRGRTAVAMMVVAAALLLLAASRWIAGPGWPRMLADLAS